MWNRSSFFIIRVKSVSEIKANKIGDQKGAKASILQALRMHGANSRANLAKLTGLSKGGVSDTAADLLASGFIRETRALPSTGGRPGIALELVPGSHVIFGAEYTNNEWTVGAFDLLGNELAAERIPLSDESPEAAVAELADVLKRFERQYAGCAVRLLGLGMPGLVDTERGVIQSAADIGWSDVPIGAMAHGELGWPAVVLNRHRARGLAECRYGAGCEMQQMVYVGVGTGIAAGLFHGRQLIPGMVGGAGEIGHITMEPHGDVCPCGNRGCLQLLSSGPAIVQEYARLLGLAEDSLQQGLRGVGSSDAALPDAESICHAADLGDPVAKQAVLHAADYLGIALASLVNLFNPQGLILGGAIPAAGSLYVSTAEKVMRERAMAPLSQGTIVRTAQIGDIGGALGAAIYALDKHMSLDILTRTG
jgi:predicted NBD/HSP70 family sugar kinase